MDWQGKKDRASIYLSDFQVFVLRLCPYSEEVVMIIILVAMQVNKTTTEGETHKQWLLSGLHGSPYATPVVSEEEWHK